MKRLTIFVLVFMVINVAINITAAIKFFHVDWSSPDIEVTSMLWLLFHCTAAAFMLISVLYIPRRWSYIVNILFHLPGSWYAFAMTAMLCFMGGPLGFIIPFVQIIYFCLFFNKRMRYHFGFVPKKQEEVKLPPADEDEYPPIIRRKDK